MKLRKSKNVSLYSRRIRNGNYIHLIRKTINAIAIKQAHQQPIIIIGMHRSGTSILSNLLERCGVIMGINMTGNEESTFMRNINKNLLDRMGFGWRCIEMLPKVDELYYEYPVLTACIRIQIKRGIGSRHFGISGTLKLLLNKSQMWGWKDPRSSLTLPIWANIFPKAKIVHIYRDGRDIALSLGVREAAREQKSFIREPRTVQRMISDIALWEEYVKRCEHGMKLFETTYTLRYEDLIIDPEKQMEKLINALGLLPKIPLRKIVSIVNTDHRARMQRNKQFAWVKNVEVDSPLLSELGYV